MPATQLNDSVRRSVIKQLKDNLVSNIDEASSILNDDDIKNALISIVTVGWKQSDGTWRKL